MKINSFGLCPTDARRNVWNSPGANNFGNRRGANSVEPIFSFVLSESKSSDKWLRRVFREIKKEYPLEQKVRTNWQKVVVGFVIC